MMLVSCIGCTTINLSPNGQKGFQDGCVESYHDNFPEIDLDNVKKFCEARSILYLNKK